MASVGPVIVRLAVKKPVWWSPAMWLTSKAYAIQGLRQVPELMLDQFLEEATARRFRDGEWDCQLFPAEWVRRVTGLDPAAAWRGRYSTALGRERILKRDGGPLAVMTRGAESVGLQRTDEPKRGDVGLIRLDGRDYGAVCLGERWALVTKSGLAAVKPDEILRAWRVNA